MSTHQQASAQGTASPTSWAEFDCLVEIARPALGLTDRDVETLTQDGPVEAVERLSGLMAARGITLPAPATPNAGTKPAAKMKSRANRPGHVNAPGDFSLKEGFYRMSNEVADNLLAAMPGPVLKAYVYAHRLARIDGTFWISYGTVAQKIGCKNQRHGRRVFGRLREAGLVRLLERGSATGGKANTYQLVPLDGLDLDRVRQTLDRPLTTKRSAQSERAAP
jgi:hypothetical protein